MSKQPTIIHNWNPSTIPKEKRPNIAQGSGTKFSRKVEVANELRAKGKGKSGKIR